MPTLFQPFLISIQAMLSLPKEFIFSCYSTEAFTQNFSTCAVGWAFLANANPEWLDR
jgi:hypothetical protein